MNMDIWVVATSYRLLSRDLYSERKFSKKNKVVTGKTLSFVIGAFCISHSICLNIGFWEGSFVWKYCTLNQKTVLQFFEKDFRFSEN